MALESKRKIKFYLFVFQSLGYKIVTGLARFDFLELQFSSKPVFNIPVMPPPLSAVWPDLAKFCHFGKKLKAFVFLEDLFGAWQNFEPTLAIFMLFGKFSML